MVADAHDLRYARSVKMRSVLVAVCAVSAFVAGPELLAQAPSDPYASILAGAPVAQLPPQE